MKTTSISFKTAQVDGFKIFYREAGDPRAPAVRHDGRGHRQSLHKKTYREEYV